MQSAKKLTLRYMKTEKTKQRDCNHCKCTKPLTAPSTSIRKRMLCNIALSYHGNKVVKWPCFSAEYIGSRRPELRQRRCDDTR
jgi:hypothetical protein